MSDITRVLKHLAADFQTGAGTSPPLGPSTMRSAFAAVLDGGASELELGALMATGAALAGQAHATAYGEVLLGLLDAVRERLVPVATPHSAYRTVVLPNFNADDGADALPLIALKLQRLGIPVLVHGAIETNGGIANCGVFREFGVLPITTRRQAERALAEDGLALVPTSLLSQGLAAMLALKGRLGLNTPAHTLAAMLLPVAEDSTEVLHVANLPHWLVGLLDDESALMAQHTLVALGSMAGAASQFGDLARRPRLLSKVTTAGEVPSWQVLFEAEAVHHGEALKVASFPRDTRGVAAWTRARLEGKLALPTPVANQLACAIFGAGYVRELSQAKAVLAVEGGCLAA